MSTTTTSTTRTTIPQLRSFAYAFHVRSGPESKSKHVYVSATVHLPYRLHRPWLSSSACNFLAINFAVGVLPAMPSCLPAYYYSGTRRFNIQSSLDFLLYVFYSSVLLPTVFYYFSRSTFYFTSAVKLLHASAAVSSSLCSTTGF